jgi:K+-sensing histidine kinase KdpD
MGTDTFFASPQRASQDEIARQIEHVSGSPVVNGVMDAVGGMLAVLNEQRQVLAVNSTLLESLDVQNPEDVLGLRPGEAVGCSHANDGPAGCGTTRFCGTCGAAIAIVASLKEDRPAERVCAIERTRGGESEDLFFAVRASPLKIDGERFLLLFLHDITSEQQRATLERAFFHDIGNLIGGLLGASSIIVEDHPDADPLIKDVYRLSSRLADEVRIQRCLVHAGSSTYASNISDVSVTDVFRSLREVFNSHSATSGKRLTFTAPDETASVRTDSSLLLRVLVNMVINALEASPAGEEVRIAAARQNGRTEFSVWNNGMIPRAIAQRIFQRNFSTKKGDGRGVGTYSMKLLGERYLGGTVDFSTSEEDGTTFRIVLPAT